jgi:hypothetical protein
MTRAYLGSGISVVLEAFATPPDLPGWMQLHQGIQTTVLVLLREILLLAAT